MATDSDEPAERSIEADLVRAQRDVNEQLVLSAMRAQEEVDNAEAALAVARTDRARLFEHAGWGVAFVSDEDHRLVAVNPALATMHGYAVDELVGCSLEQLCPPSARALLAEELQLVAKMGHRSFEGLHMRKDGSVFPCLTEATKSSDREGARPVSAYNFQDVSERTQLKARLVVSDRLAALGTMSAGIAHEINNPLTYNLASIAHVRTELPVLLDDVRRLVGAGEPAWPAIEQRVQSLLAELQHAQEGGQRIERIVAGMKTFARPLDERIEPADLQKMLEAAVRICREQCAQRARVVTDFGRAPRVDCNDGQLGQVFVNLLVNATQAIEPGSPETNEIRVVLGTDADGNAIVEVRDTGCGMSPETLREIYDPFFTTKPIGVGSGLGLSISHGIITTHGGQISVESELGKGSVFRVRLPPSRRAPKIEEATPAPTRSSRRAKILIVDDDPLVARALQRLLKEHEVVALSSAQSAVTLLAGGASFDVIFCDLMMPDMTGMELHAWVTASRPDQATRMLFVTGGAVGVDSSEFIDRMASQVVMKPFDRRSIAARLAELLETHDPLR